MHTAKSMELQSLGKYRLVDPLPANSSDNEFYAARHEDEPDQEPPSYVAKLIKLGRGPEAAHQRAWFEHEVRLLKSFNHPGIPTLHAAGEQDGIPYIVMDRVDGVDLATLLGHGAEPRALTKEIAVYVMGQLADAVRHIHTLEYLEAGEPTPLDVVHRNICPTNILLSRGGDVILAGFGSSTSRWLPPEHDVPDAGDVAYMAPERVAEGGRATPSTDLFAMAVTLWEMLKGQRCLAGATPAETRDNILRFDIAQSGRRVSGLSSKLSEIVRKNLDRDPNRRYPDAYKLLQRLAQAAEAQAAEESRAALGQAVEHVLATS